MKDKTGHLNLKPEGQDLISETYLMDCILGMKEYPDKFFDLAVVDPPYGNNLSGGRSAKNGWNPNINWDKCNMQWVDWVENKIKRGAKQKQCPKCGRWYFKCEY